MPRRPRRANAAARRIYVKSIFHERLCAIARSCHNRVRMVLTSRGGARCLS
jgi:hypothetical protein